MKNVALIGFMGTGKTAVGKRLARLLGWEFIDTDAEIERLTGKSIPRLFAEDGEVRFRSEENLICRRLAGRSGLVIATGGGMVLNPENVGLLKQNGVLIKLYADPEVIIERVKSKKKRRPLLTGKVEERVRELLAERAGAYDIAEFAVDTGKQDPETSARIIYNYLKERKYIGDGSKG
ncbi:MAG: shikimate kinase [Bacillota bacterium]|jgi:shikimate kinase|nr:shikimate kinase [Thermoanaerobacteraceae bacterium]